MSSDPMVTDTCVRYSKRDASPILCWSSGLEVAAEVGSSKTKVLPDASKVEMSGGRGGGLLHGYLSVERIWTGTGSLAERAESMKQKHEQDMILRVIRAKRQQEDAAIRNSYVEGA